MSSTAVGEDRAVPRPTVKDVARHAGVSQGVVSRVVNPGTGPVSAATRERVQASIDALGYRPHRGARDLKNASAGSIGLLLADVRNEFYSALADDLVDLARERGLGVLLMTTQEDASVERSSLDLLMEQRVGGIIGAPVGEDGSVWEQARRFGVELVFIDRALAQVPQADVVGVDNRHAARLATDHLLGLGHRRIGLVGGPEWTSTARERAEGHRASLEAAGVGLDDALVRYAPFRGGAGTAVVDALLDLPEPPTALVVGNTAAARSVVGRLGERGVRVPDDISVVVFHDLTWTSMTTPAFTVVRHDVRALAEVALERLVGRMAAPDAAGSTHLARSELVVRGSTGRPRRD